MASSELRLGLMVRIFAVLAVATVVALAIAPAKSVFTEWRDVQERYNELAAKPVPVGIQQIWNEKLGIVDRCVSCHLPAGGAAAVPGDPFFTAHPEIPHDPTEFGCTLCHGGQGRATKKAAAHGETLHWEVPLLETAHLAAGCGSCHSGVRAGSPLSDRGGDLLVRYDCLACHRLNGRGGGRAAPDVMADLGAGGASDGWHERHLRMREQRKHPLFAECYGEIPPEAVGAISEYLTTLSGMPALQAGRRVFLKRGCRGCHKVNGVGGSEGADLTAAGAKAAEAFLFPRGWTGEETAYAWHVAHLLSPGEVVPESRMPDQGLPRGEAEQVALYLLSLRKADVPMDYWPPDRIRVDRFGERDFPGDGRSLYAGFCSACHGENGEGRPFGVHGEEYPAVASADLLAVATDEFLVKTILAGRPGRRMPGFGPEDGGLTEGEVREIVRWLRTTEAVAPGIEAVRAAAADARLGRETYELECAVCHGAGLEGDVGPSLDSPAFRELATDRFVLGAIADGRPGTSMPAFRELDARTLASLLAHLGVRAGDGTARRFPNADARRGGEVFAASCATCHGPDGEGGGRAPGIGRRGFWRTADLDFAVGSYERRRCRDAAGAPAPTLPQRDLASAAAWLEERAGRGAPEPLLPRVEGDLRLGKHLYRRACAGCHGEDGAGKEAPALGNEAFLSTASDAYIRTTIVRGRRGTAMPRFDSDSPKHRRLGAREIDAITAYVRSFGRATKEDDQ